MPQPKHTPGPWEWVDRGRSFYLVHFVPGEKCPDGNPLYVQVHSDGSAGGEYGPDIDVEGPDARLIAAAPDLLAACKSRLASLLEDGDPFDGGDWQEVQDLRAVIAKAEGATDAPPD